MNVYKMKDGSLLAALALLAIFVSDVAAQLTISMEHAVKPTDSSIIVSCSDNKGRPIKWRGPKGPLGPNTKPRLEKHSYWTAINFQHIQLNDAGNYVCFLPEGESKTFHLEIDSPPVFVDTRTSQEGEEGTDAIVRCEVKNGRVFWTMGNDTLSDATKYQQMGDGLLIKNVQRNDSNVYTCQAIKGSLGSILSRDIQFSVLHKPVPPDGLVYAKQEVVYGYVGGSVNLTCVALANPVPVFNWVVKRKRTEKIGQVTPVNDTTSVLQLHIDSNATFGEYMCSASNRLGTLDVHFSLEEGSKPSPPKSFAFVQTKSTSLDVEIEGPDANEEGAQQGMEPRGFLVHYRGARTDGWASQEFDLAEDNVYSVEGLDAETDYEVKIATKNAAGFSDFTEVKSHKTTKSAGSRIYLCRALLMVVLALVPFCKFPSDNWS